MNIRIVVAGDPSGQPRARSRVIQPRVGEAYSHIYTPDVAKGWKGSIYVHALAKRPREKIAGAVRVDATFFFERPQRLLKASSPTGLIPHTTKPDRDNLDKVVLDALKNAHYFKDDCQVFAGEIVKWYAAKHCRSGVLIQISTPTENGQMPLELEPGGRT